MNSQDLLELAAETAFYKTLKNLFIMAETKLYRFRPVKYKL